MSSTDAVRGLRSLASALVMCAAALGAPAAVLAATPVAAAEQSRASRELNALFDEYWEWVMVNNPGYATFLGDRRFDDRLGDQSAEAIRKEGEEARAYLQRARAIDPVTLTADERISRDVFIRDLGSEIEIRTFYGNVPIKFANPVTLQFGPQLGLPALVRATRFSTVADYEAYLKRLAAIPLFLEQIAAQLKAGAASGWTAPRVAVQGVPAQIGAQVVADPAKSAFFAPFRSFPADIPTAEQERLRTAGEAVIREKVVPAFAALRQYFETEYLPLARTDVAASRLPGGVAYYNAVLRNQTTTDLSAQQIHETGLQEVQRIETEMNEVMRSTGFKGTRAEFVAYLWSDPKFFYATPAELLAALRDIAKRADAETPKLFRVLPRQPYGIRAMPPERGDAAARYTPGAPDGSRAGFYEANANNLKNQPKWQQPTIVLHEAAPGHHTQGARAQELEGVPAFRRFAWKPAYGEGWALYAERLGHEMGLYEDPYDRYGNLSGELLRAARMVVDTGLHTKGWTRAQAVEYMTQHTTENAAFIESEVDRYIVWPGQATSYKVGQLKILELRAKAKAALGDRFDLRAFHNVIIDSGPLPLAVVESNVDLWIAEQKAKAPLRKP